VPKTPIHQPKVNVMHERTSNSTTAPAVIDPNRLSASEGRAVTFLKSQIGAGNYGLKCLGSDGLPRFSDDKGHAFSCYFLARALDRELSEAERAMLIVRFMSEEYRGLWGYSPHAPDVSRPHRKFLVDADDTSFVIRTCRQLGLHKSSIRLFTFHRKGWPRFWSKHGPEWLLDRWGPKGGFRTFASRVRASLVFEPTPANNLQIHPEVNLNVFLALRGTALEKSIDYELVRKSQHEDGHWHSYFYPSRYYGTWMALELIRDEASLKPLRDRARQFLVSSQSDDGTWGAHGNAYETALACLALQAAGEAESVLSKSISSLLDSQLDDGSWKTDQDIWRFHSADDDIWRAFDANRVITTSLVRCALRQHSYDQAR
jgi:hypothetical protein